MDGNHSENFDKVKRYYKKKLWSLEQVKSSVNRWITPAEYQEITGLSYR